MSDYLLGIDAGNTMVKAVLFDSAGNELAVEERTGSTSYPEPGQAERSIDEIRRFTVEAIRGCIAKSGIDPAEVRAVGAAGHGNGAYVLDRDGTGLLGIQSIDRRAEAIAGGLGEKTGQIHRWSRQQPWAGQTPLLMRWLGEHRPEIMARAHAVLLCKDVIVHFLTGTLSGDYSDAAVAGLVRFPERRYDAEMLEAYGVAHLGALLPPLRESCEIVGGIRPEVAQATGLRVGTPVVAGMIDIVASAVGSGVSATGQASIVAGTWSINQEVVDDPELDELVFMTSIIEKDRYMAVEASATSAANLEWFIREFGSGIEVGTGTVASACSELVARVSPSMDLPLFHPFIYGSSGNARARGGFYGIAGWHDKAHLLYGLFEGVVFGHRQHVEKLKRAGATFENVVLSGGAARSKVWPQMFADILGIPIRTSLCSQTGALGAAIAAGVGAGLFPDLGHGVARMVKTAQSFTPSPRHKALHDRRYRLFLTLAELMEPVWDELHAADA